MEDLEKALIENLSKMETKSYESFENMMMKSFDSVSARKECSVGANEKPYVTKEMKNKASLATTNESILSWNWRIYSDIQ